MTKKTTQNTTKKKRPVLTTLIIALAIIGILAIVAVALAPRFLAQQATQAPENTGTFVTRQIEDTDLSSRMQAAIQNAPEAQAPLEVQIESQQNAPNNSPTETSPQHQQVMQGNPDAAPNTTPPTETYGDTAPTGTEPVQEQSTSQETTPQTYQEPPTERTPLETRRPRAPQSQNDVPLQRPKDFQFQISQNEISGMIYNGLVRGTAPAYRQSIQGVSTQISGGRAKITVALLPKYLPDAFLQRLPGIDRSTPTVYLGGEMGLNLSGNSVEPRIHRVSLGNMGVPMPFIESAVRSQVQAYVRNATRLPNGQQAQLQSIQLENGAVQIQGRTP